MKQFSRRDFLRLAGFSLLTPYTLTNTRAVSVQTDATASQPINAKDAAQIIINKDQQSEPVFGLSIASGDPSPTGVVLWTRINPEVWATDQQLAFEVASDDQFQQVVVQGVVAGQDFGSERDYTVTIDLDGKLASDQFYYYRFIYNGTASHTGRCHTLPAADQSVDNIRFGVVTCQDYTNGYYGAFAQLAQEEIDFVIHLGDFIYEYSGDPNYYSLPYPDREFSLPSGQAVSFGLEDYRFLYRTYRSDPFLQMALEKHTWIIIWDDHDTADDCYWDYDRDTLGAPVHPYQIDPQYGDDPARLNQLKLDSQRAWAEYVPARVHVNEGATHPHEYLQIYRQFAFGNLVDLFMTDERTYRSPHPCGEATAKERYGSPGCSAQEDPSRSMLGLNQRTWLLNGLKGSKALWKVWGNEVLQGAFDIGSPDTKELFVTLDSWDGYEYERSLIMREVRDASIRNFIVLTGDLHSYIASYLKIDYTERLNTDQNNVVGVEFMTPAVTSANFREIILNAVTHNAPEEQAIRRIGSRSLLEPVVRATNPHVHFFNSEYWGYSIVEFNRQYCEYTAYSIDKSQNSADAARRVLRRLRVPVNRIRIVDA